MTYNVQRSRHERFLEWDEVELPAESTPQEETHVEVARNGRPTLVSRIAGLLSGKRQLTSV